MIPPAARCLPLLALLLVGPLVLRPCAAQAQSTGADALLDHGVDLRRQGRDDEALDSFRQAWERFHVTRARAQMALAEQSLGRWREADEHLREAFAAAPDPWMVRNRTALQAALGTINRHLGQLVLRAGVAGAEAWVNGHLEGRLPLPAPLRLAAGTVTVEVRAPGHRPASRTVVVPAEALALESFDLVREATAVVLPLASVPPPGARAAAPARPATRSARRLAGWLSAGGAVLLVAGGAAALAVREGAATRFNGPGCLSTTAERIDNCPDTYARARVAGALSIAGFAAGGALAVVSIVLFATSPARGHEAVARAGLVPGPGDLGLSYRTNF